MGAIAPQWLFSSFVEAMQEVGATAPVGDLEEEARNLVGRWTAPDRHVHNIRHLINVLAHVDELATTSHDPDVLRVAAWYHGAILNKAVDARVTGLDVSRIATDCASRTQARLEELGVSEDVAVRIAELIRDLALHTAPADDLDAQVLVDADLASLAATPQDYKKYRLLLRQEYTQVDDLTYLRARRLVVRSLLARPTVFHSPLGQAWESRARENLEAELAKLDEAIGDLDPADAAVSELVDSDPSVTVVDGPTRAHPTESDCERSLTSTGTIIIRRRHLHKNVTAPAEETETPHRGQLPDLSDAADTRDEPAEGESESSTLETAIDALDVPSRPSDQS